MDDPAGVEVRRLPATVHGRYLVREPREPAVPAPLVVGFHGYGEDAAAHLGVLERIPGIERWRVIAIQGLHPFYTRSGEVVASWMTRLDRELAIADNVRYVGEVVRRETAGPWDGTLVYTGFSQGVAMAWRAAALAGHPCHGLIVLAGDVPPDVAERGLTGLPPVLIGRGRDDAWYTSEKLAADLDLLRAQGVAVETCTFDGGHVWSDAFARAAGELLGRVGRRGVASLGA